MKNANGTGCIHKLSGNRRKPYAVILTTGTEYDEKTDTYKQRRKYLGYFATQQDARKYLAMYNDAPCDPEYVDITFAEIWETIKPKLFEDLSEKRCGCYSAAYKYITCADKRIKDIKTPDLQKCIDGCEYKSSTKQNIKTVMAKVYEYAMQNDYVSKDYSKYVKFEKDATSIKRLVFTPAEVETLWDNQGDWIADMMLVLLYTGMRINEFLSSKSIDIDLDNKTITLPRNIVKNDSSARIVPIHERIIPILERFKSRGKEHIAVKPNGTQIQYKNFMGRDLKKLNELLGVRHTPHDTRHSFITRARECGCDNLVIQRIVGHAPETITEQVYTHLTIEELIEQINLVKY